MPIASYPGRTPTNPVETLIKPTTIASVSRRPSRSPSDPKNRAPSGRVTNATENAAKAAIRLTIGSLLGKNTFARVADR
ncbi:hypothetical protein D3C87_1592630 [compost metagenome]